MCPGWTGKAILLPLILSSVTPWFVASCQSCCEQSPCHAQYAINCTIAYVSKGPYESLVFPEQSIANTHTPGHFSLVLKISNSHLFLYKNVYFLPEETTKKKCQTMQYKATQLHSFSLPLLHENYFPT